MFTSDLAESKQDKVSLYDVDPDAVEALIDYAYSNKVHNVFLLLTMLSAYSNKEHYNVFLFKIKCICCGNWKLENYDSINSSSQFFLWLFIS